MIRRLSRGRRLGAAALVLFSFGATAHAQDEVTVMLDWFVNPDHGPIVIADELGYYAEAGLEVEIIAPSDPALPPRLVAAGRADLAIGYQPQLHIQVDAGLDLVQVGALVSTPLNCLLVRADGPIETLADLKGRTVGFSVAGVEEALLTALLEPVGLTLDDIEMVDVAFDLAPALTVGNVDAVIGAYRNFELTQLALNGVEGRCFYVEEHGVPVYDELIYVAQGTAMREDAAKRDAIRRFLTATERATRYMINHPDEAWEMFRASAPELDTELNRRAWYDTLPRFALRPVASDRGRYAAFAAFLLEAGLIDAPQTPDMVMFDLGATQ